MKTYSYIKCIMSSSAWTYSLISHRRAECEAVFFVIVLR